MYYIVPIPAEPVMITLWQSTLPSLTGEGGLSEQEAAATQDTTAEVSVQIDIVDIETYSKGYFFSSGYISPGPKI